MQACQVLKLLSRARVCWRQAGFVEPIQETHSCHVLKGIHPFAPESLGLGLFSASALHLGCCAVRPMHGTCGQWHGSIPNLLTWLEQFQICVRPDSNAPHAHSFGLSWSDANLQAIACDPYEAEAVMQGMPRDEVKGQWTVNVLFRLGNSVLRFSCDVAALLHPRHCKGLSLSWQLQASMNRWWRTALRLSQAD